MTQDEEWESRLNTNLGKNDNGLEKETSKGVLVCGNCGYVVSSKRPPKHSWLGVLICPDCNGKGFHRDSKLSDQQFSVEPVGQKKNIQINREMRMEASFNCKELSAKELYSLAFNYFERKQHSKLLELCNTLFAEFPNSKEAKFALKHFPITWDRDKQKASLKSTHIDKLNDELTCSICCGNSFEYDNYFKEYICKSCGNIEKNTTQESLEKNEAMEDSGNDWKPKKKTISQLLSLYCKGELGTMEAALVREELGRRNLSKGMLRELNKAGKRFYGINPKPTESEEITKSAGTQRKLFPGENRLKRVTQSESLVFIIQMTKSGLLTFITGAAVVGFLLYAFGIRDNPDWNLEPGLYRFISYTYLIAGFAAANICGRYTRKAYGRRLTPIVITALAVTLVIELVIWSTFIPVETFIRSEFFSLPPNESHELFALWLFGALCTVGWVPIFEGRH